MNLTVEIVEYLRPGRFIVPLAIGDVVELVRPDRAARFSLCERFRETAGVADIIVGVGIGNGGNLDQFGAGEAQHVLLLLRLGVGDDNDRAIAERARHHRDANPGISGGALDDRSPGTKRPTRGSVFDDRQRGAVLDRAPGIHEFRLAENGASGRLGGGSQLDERRSADRANDIALKLHRVPRNPRPD